MPIHQSSHDTINTHLVSGSLEISPHAATARRVLVVLSPDSLGAAWSEAGLAGVLKQLSGLAARTIVVALKEPPSAPSAAKAGRGRAPRARHPTAQVQGPEVLRWRDPGDRQFWYRLRLALPAVRPAGADCAEAACQSVAMVVQPGKPAQGQQKARSRESLEVLV